MNTQYFRALRIPLLRGRNFTEQEVRQGAKVVVISELLARQVFANEEPLGKRLVMVMGNQPFEIIGIVGDIRHRALESAPFRNTPEWSRINSAASRASARERLPVLRDDRMGRW